jgi:hypothetical protein
MKPTRSRREFLLNRVDELNIRVKSLVSTAGLERSGSLSADEVKPGLQVLRIARARRHRAREPTDNARDLLSTAIGSYPRLVEDILLLIVEEISPRVDLENFPTSNDIATLRSMRL